MDDFYEQSTQMEPHYSSFAFALHCCLAVCYYLTDYWQAVEIPLCLYKAQTSACQLLFTRVHISLYRIVYSIIITDITYTNTIVQGMIYKRPD